MNHTQLTLTETVQVIELILLENGLYMDSLHDPDIRAMFISNNLELKLLRQRLERLKNVHSASY